MEKKKKTYWWMMIVGSIAISLIGGEVVRFLNANDVAPWICNFIAIFCSLAALIMLTEGLWIIINKNKNDKKTIK